MTIDVQETFLDLRSGRSVWELDAAPPTASAPAPRGAIKTDVAIVGAGITGAFVAERLTRSGRRVVLLDRHAPQRGSTAACTALIQWEIDVPLSKLEEKIGFRKASAIYRRSLRTVREIGALIGRLQIDCDYAKRETLYLCGDELDAAALREEGRIREKAGLPGAILTAEEIKTRFGFQRDAAILSPGSAEIDPIALARGLLEAAMARGALLLWPATVETYESDDAGVTLTTTDGLEISADALVLANGYETPSFIPSCSHEVVSTWALATEPQREDVLWSGRALVWEASDPYFYMRTTADGRIVIGGADESLTDPTARDAKTAEKVKTLLAALKRFSPKASLKVAASWAGFFGGTEDGLPLIGRVPGRPRCFAAYGYGGNGVTFSAMAASMLDAMAAGRSHPAEALFAIDR